MAKEIRKITQPPCLSDRECVCLSVSVCKLYQENENEKRTSELGKERTPETKGARRSIVMLMASRSAWLHFISSQPLAQPPGHQTSEIRQRRHKQGHSTRHWHTEARVHFVALG